MMCFIGILNGKMCNLNPQLTEKSCELIYTSYILKNQKTMCSVGVKGVPPK